MTIFQTYKLNMRAAQKFLEMCVPAITDPYTAALTSLALTRLHSEQSGPAATILHQMAIVRGKILYLF